MDLGPATAIIGCLLTGLAFVWNISRADRAAMTTRINAIEQSQEDDRKQARHFETEIARNYVSKGDLAALDGRLMTGISELNRKFDALNIYLMEKRGERP